MGMLLDDADCIRPLSYEDLSQAVEILHQESLKYVDGRYPDKDWLIHFITDGYAYGYFNRYDGLISVLFAENLLAGGVLLWYIATKPNYRSNGYGTWLLQYFEEYAIYGKDWIFLNATSDSLSFYSKNGFVTGKHSTVHEHYKEFNR